MCSCLSTCHIYLPLFCTKVTLYEPEVVWLWAALQQWTVLAWEATNIKRNVQWSQIKLCFQRNVWPTTKAEDRRTEERRRQVWEGREQRVEMTQGERDGMRGCTAVSVPQSWWMHRSWLALDTAWAWKTWSTTATQFIITDISENQLLWMSSFFVPHFWQCFLK